MNLKRFFKRKRRDADLVQELEAHLALEVDENIGRGLTPEAARRRAYIKFGSRRQVRETLWQQNSITTLDNLLSDLRYAFRTLRKTPGFTLTAILTLALGIGANSAIFTLMNALLLRSLPVRDPSTLVRITMNVQMAGNPIDNMPVNGPIVDFLSRHAKSFEGIFGWSRRDFVLNIDGSLRSYHGALIGGSAFNVLGVRPALGRLLAPQDDQPGGGPQGWAVVISHRLWMSTFHGNPAIIGRSINVADQSMTIVGVAPVGFEGVVIADCPDIYVPLNFEPVLRGPQSQLHGAAALWLAAFARLSPDVKATQAQAELATLQPAMFDAILPAAVRHLPFIERSRLVIEPGRTGWTYLPREYTRSLLLLQSMVATVLLICCANLCGLCLARASARQKEFAIRGALGAAPVRLLRQVLVESLVLACSGALLGVALAWPAARIMVLNMGDRQVAQSLSARPDWSVLLITAICAVCCAMLFGIAPAWQARRIGLEPVMRQVNRHGHRAGLRSLFIPLQVGLSIALVVVAALLATTLWRLQNQNAGFRTANVLFAPFDFSRLPEKGQALIDLYLRIGQQMEQMPGLDQVSLAQITPLSGVMSSASFAASGQSAFAVSSTNQVGPRYFAAIGTPLIAGRDFSAQSMGSDECILSQAAAGHYFPHGNALGQTLRQLIRQRNTGVASTKDCEVIGISANAKYSSLRDAAPSVVYTAIGPDSEDLSRLFFILHGQDDTAMLTACKTVLHQMAPAAPEIDPVSFASQFNESIARDRLLSLLSGFFAILAMLLSGIGIYGVVAWSVSNRTAEIGIRMALGATRAAVISLVLRNMLFLLAAGLVIGGAAAWFAAHSIRSFLFGVAPGNPAWFALAAVALLLTATIAALLPARRAASIDPVQALRTE